MNVKYNRTELAKYPIAHHLKYIAHELTASGLEDGEIEVLLNLISIIETSFKKTREKP